MCSSPARRSSSPWPTRSPPSAPARRPATGEGHRTVGDLLTNLDRANFRIEAFHELGVDDTTPVPTTLVMKARKQGS